MTDSNRAIKGRRRSYSDEERAAIVRDAAKYGVVEAHPGLGPSQIRNQLRRRQIRVSVSTVRAAVLRDFGHG